MMVIGASLTKIKFKIITEPTSYQKVFVKTWPLAPNRLSYRREYCIENENGERLIVGSSEWVVIDSEKRRLVSAPDLYPFTDGFHTEIMCEEKLGKVEDFEISSPYIVKAGFSDLDVNNHVNNTRYANYVMDAIAPDENEVLELFQIDYRKEVTEGTKLHLYSKKEGKETLARGVNDNGDTMFACLLEYK